MKRYLVLFAVTLLVAVVVAPLARRASAPRREPAGTAVPPAITVEIAVAADGVDPATLSLPKDARVRLVLSNAGATALRVSLAGYEDRLGAIALAPGERWEGELLADRPGEDFAWLIDGRPTGRLQVTGSHLVEGHR